MSFFEDFGYLTRFLFEWVGSWPGWLQIAVIVTVGPVMVVHFLTWVWWRLGWLDEDGGDNVIPFRRRDGGS